MGTKDRQSPAKKKHVTAVATAVALGGGTVVGWLLRGGAEAKSRAQEQSDATIVGDQPGHETQAEIAGEQPGHEIEAGIAGEQPRREVQATSASDQPGRETQAEIAGEQPSREVQARSQSDQSETTEKPQCTDLVEVIGRVVLVAMLLVGIAGILSSAFAGWTLGDTSAKQATAAAVALLAVQFSASTLLIHKRWAWIFCDIASAGFTFASLVVLLPDTPTGNSLSVLFAFLAIVPFAVLRCAEYLRVTESVPIWDFYSRSWRVEQMRAEHARIAQLDADRKEWWGRRRKAVRKAQSVLRDRLLRRRKRAGSGKR